MRRVGYATLTFGTGLLTAAAPMTDSPRAAKPGLWEISHSATGVAAERICLPDPMILSQWEHRGGACTRVVIADLGAELTIHYTCAGGGFGQSTVTLLTLRTMRIETQGISDGLPFNYVLHARRKGDCLPR